MKIVLLVLCLFIGVAWGEVIKLCAWGDIDTTACSSLQKARSVGEVTCEYVLDSAECAIKLAKGEADFGIFTPEEMLLAYQFYPEELMPIKELRDADRKNEASEFRSVAVIRENFYLKNRLEGLRNGGLCHPGVNTTVRWNDNVLKYFEKKVHGQSCDSNLTAAENEAVNLKNFFGKSCRPGQWTADEAEDRRLKSKYPELCALCDDKFTCSYKDMGDHGHSRALECLFTERGNVAYVAYDNLKKYISLQKSTQQKSKIQLGLKLLCPDGTTANLTSPDSCAWVKQPWSAILARKDRASEILKYLDNTSRGGLSALGTIINKKGQQVDVTGTPKLGEYLSGRELKLPTNTCGKNIRWCTINDRETNKCNWVANATLAYGIEPRITCEIANSTFGCLKKIADNEADIITIDSNYGYIARNVFNLTPALYTQTEINSRSKVIAVVLKNASNKVTSWKGLRKRYACFPEYGGISWLSFLNTLRTSKIVGDSCKYPQVVSGFLAGACTPGLKDADHLKKSTTVDASSILCSSCPPEVNGVTCSANDNNKYYGDKGALDCVVNGAGDIAFIEANNFEGNVQGINPDDYQVLCKNGSLADYSGFQVDDQCALSVTIDSEIVTRKNNTEVFTKDLTSVLLKIENSFGYDAGVTPIRLYDSFDRKSNLLFKDSTIGLASTSSEIKTVMAYKELFYHAEACAQMPSGVAVILANIFTVYLMASITFAIFH